MLAHFALVALAALPSVTAFGAVGNQAVALVAQNFMTAKTLKAVKQILGGDGSVAIVNAATYGNRYSVTPEGAWSYPGFYMCKQCLSVVDVSTYKSRADMLSSKLTDPNDDPSTVCNLSVLQACSTAGCSMTAFGNFVRSGCHIPRISTCF